MGTTAILRSIDQRKATSEGWRLYLAATSLITGFSKSGSTDLARFDPVETKEVGPNEL